MFRVDGLVRKSFRLPGLTPPCGMYLLRNEAVPRTSNTLSS